MTPRVGISPRCLGNASALTMMLWAIILGAITYAPMARVCCAPVQDVRHG